MRYDVILPMSGVPAEALGRCAAAILRADYDLALLNVVVASGPFNQQTADVFTAIEHQAPGFGGLELLFATRKKNQPASCNLGARNHSAPWLVFIDPTYEISPDYFKVLDGALEAYPGADAFEGRPLPDDVSHVYHPASLVTPVLQAGLLAIRRAPFDVLGGFEAELPTEWSVIDFSLRLRKQGCTLYHLPGAVAHRTTQLPEDARQDYLDAAKARLLLSYAFGGKGQANSDYIDTMCNPRHFPGVRKELIKGYLSHFARLWHYLGSRGGGEHPLPDNFWQEAALDRGTEPLAQRVTKGPLVSVIVRTHKRPEALREALASLAHQTYQGFEVVVVEDGEATAEAVTREFTGLELRYHPTGAHVGRSRTGNLGLEMAKGEYLCFLDDDDLLYPEHLELFVAKALAHPEADLILGTGLVRLMDFDEVAEQHLMHFDRLDAFTMCQMCQIPIETALFKKSLYQACGGLDERLDAHEDWAMWLRFLAGAKRIHPHHVDIHRATSVFTQTADTLEAEHRLAEYRKNDEALFGDESIRFTVTLKEMRDFYDGMLADIRHVKGLGKLDEFLEEQARRDER